MIGDSVKHSPHYPSAKVAIVGAGFVGSTAAYAIMMSGCATEIALIDINKNKAEGEALDLMHCMQFTTSASIVAGDDFALVQDAAIVVIAAGVGQKIGQTRTDLLTTNVSMFKTIIPKIIQHNKDCILLVVTNPLDVLTYLTLKLSGFPSCRVLGTGTVLDTARLRYLMGQHFQISPKDITAYILGEHGDSEFVWWSCANIAGMPLDQLPSYSVQEMEKMFLQAKDAAYQIIQKKGATYYAIALIVAKIVRAILLDQSRIFTVSSLIDNVYGISGVCLSLPIVVRKSGISQRLPVVLSEQEKKNFLDSAQKIKKEIGIAAKIGQF